MPLYVLECMPSLGKSHTGAENTNDSAYGGVQGTERPEYSSWNGAILIQPLIPLEYFFKDTTEVYVDSFEELPLHLELVLGVQ